MISNQILQNTIEGLKGITRIDLCVMDIDGKVLASTFPENGDYENAIKEPGLIRVEGTFFCSISGRQPGDPGISVLQDF